ncbi:MAG: chorismate-binding protein [Acidobacteriota bacterium]
MTPSSPPDPGNGGAPKRAVVHVREFLADTLTPLSVYRRLEALSPVRFMLESVTGGEQVSRFSFLGARPRELYRLYPDRLEVERDGQRRDLDGPALAALRKTLRGIAAEPGPIPFTGGFVGFFGYDLVRLIESLPSRPGDDPFELPIAVLGRFDTLVVFDHAQQRVLALSNEIEGEVTLADAERELRELSEVLTAPSKNPARAMPTEGPAEPVTPGPPSIDGATYRGAVERAKEYIRAGDIFQVVLARRWTVPEAPGPVALYRALRLVNPSPYMVLLEMPDATLVGASPEMLVRKTGLRIENRPIAGTRPRGVDAEGDRVLAEDLKGDPKERAEHVMLVDLGRNDVGKVGAPGTVKVESFMEVERYSHVMHLVSSVQADLDDGMDGLDALLACFPAGTLSGAPKIRAMEIIDELEPETRGPYGGAVGYFSYSGDVDTCITIRTLVVKDGETSVSAGAGIVADSDPASEERETESKAAGLLAAVELAKRLED